MFKINSICSHSISFLVNCCFPLQYPFHPQNKPFIRCKCNIVSTVPPTGNASPPPPPVPFLLSFYHFFLITTMSFLFHFPHWIPLKMEVLRLQIRVFPPTHRLIFTFFQTLFLTGFWLTDKMIRHLIYSFLT